MIAPPGAGKGTQGAVLAEHLGVPHIASGDLLRDHVARRTEIGRSVQQFVERGELVPDDVVLEMVRSALLVADDGYVLDGVPRTMAQARALYDAALEMDATADVALHLQVGEAELVRRLLARAEEQGRADDTDEVIRHRLALYDEVTHPILDWYDDRGILVSVDAEPSADDVSRHVITALEVVRQIIAGNPDAPRTAINLTGLGKAFGA